MKKLILLLFLTGCSPQMIRPPDLEQKFSASGGGYIFITKIQTEGKKYLVFENSSSGLFVIEDK